MLPKENKCCGCSACASICPQKCIAFLENKEGFDIPVVNENECIQCKMCEKVCPILTPMKKNSNAPETVIVQNRNEDIRKKSSAGGVVGAFFEYVFSLNGIGYAVGYTVDNFPKFFRVTSIEECHKYKIFSSKYVSAEIEGIFQQIKKDLLENKMVCFVGLPCQVEGLTSFLQKRYSNLLLIDLTCYGCPSRKVYRNYLQYLEKKYHSKVADVRFRDKVYGYSAPTMRVEFENGKVLSQNSTIKSYLRCFFANITLRLSCYNCQFKGVSRVSDYTVGDCKNVKDFYPEYDDDLGTTVLYVHTEKGTKILQEIKDKIKFSDVPLEQILKSCGTKMIECPSLNSKRMNFFSDISHLEYEELVEKYCPPTISEYLASFIKFCILKLHLNHTKILRKLLKR